MGLRVKISQSIQTRLFLLLLIALLPTLVIQCYIYYDRYETRRVEELQANLEVARSVSMTFDAFVKDVLGDELTLGLAATSSPSLSSGDFARILRESASENPAIRNYTWGSPEGRVLASTLSPSGTDFSYRSSFREIVSGREWVVSDLILSRTTGEPVFSISRGIRDEKGSLLGIVTAVVVPDRLDRVLAVERTKGAGVSLIDSKGMIVYRHPATEYTWEQRNWLLKTYPELEDALKGREIATTIRGSKTGKKRLAGFAPVSSIGWVTVASRAEEEVTVAITSELLSNAILFLLVTLIAFGSALALSRRISGSIGRLRNHALTLGKGEMEDLAVAPGPSEIEELAKAFNEMARKVQSRETALRQSEEFLRAIFESTENAIIIVDEHQRCVEANPAAGAITGVSHEDLVGRALSDFIDPGQNPPAAWPVFIQNGRFAGEIGIRHRDGTRRTVEAVGVANILPGRHLFCGHDITERKQAEEALRAAHARMSSILERMSDGFVTFDRDWRYTQINPAAANMFHMRPEQLLWKTLWEMWPAAYDHPLGAHFRRSLQENIPLQFETFYPEPLNRWFECRCHPTPEGLVTFFSDITERKHSEDGLRRSEQRYRSLHAELELRVQARTTELERRNLELQEFTFVAAHDLSEPLRKIQVFGSLLGERSADRLDEHERDYISRITGAAGRMQDLLDALLRYSRVDTKGQEFTPARLEDVVKDAVSDVDVLMNEVAARVEIGPLPTVMGDPNQLRQLFQNLLANAVKYHRSEVRTVIKIKGEEENGNCRILVEDNGIGFDEKYMEKIFQPFQRLHGRNEYPGIGMGLAICRKIVERHHGTITAKSTPGKGSTFIITLPRTEMS